MKISYKEIDYLTEKYLDFINGCTIKKCVCNKVCLTLKNYDNTNYIINIIQGIIEDSNNFYIRKSIENNTISFTLETKELSLKFFKNIQDIIDNVTFDTNILSIGIPTNISIYEINILGGFMIEFFKNNRMPRCNLKNLGHEK